MMNSSRPKIVLLADGTVLVNNIHVRSVLSNGSTWVPSTQYGLNYCRRLWAEFFRVKPEDIEVDQGL